MVENCQNCEQTITGKFCSNCGEIRELKRIDKKYAIQEFLNLVGFEHGFLFTCKALFLKPGETIRNYIKNSRKTITKPITFLALTSVIYTIISHYFATDNPYSELSKKAYGNSSLNNITNWIQDNYGYANLLMIFPITFWTILFFRKHKYNFYETFIVISFVMGIGMLIFSLEPIFNKLHPTTFILNESIIMLISFIYMSWAIGQFYEKRTKNYIKAFFAYSFGFLTFQIVTMASGIIYDVMTKR